MSGALLPAAPATRRQHLWLCDGCEVTVRHESGALIPEPNGWAAGLCVTCQRRELQEEGKKGSDSLLRFELLRGAPLRKAARRAGLPLASARATRTNLIRAG